jgi:hypothetical protein
MKTATSPMQLRQRAKRLQQEQEESQVTPMPDTEFQVQGNQRRTVSEDDGLEEVPGGRDADARESERPEIPVRRGIFLGEEDVEIDQVVDEIKAEVAKPARKRATLTERYGEMLTLEGSDIALVSKVCGLVPVEGTALGERFNHGLMRARIFTIGGAYREILKEQEVKDRFAVFEKDYETLQGFDLREAIRYQTEWLSEHLGCDDFQAMSLTLLVVVRRLAADPKRVDLLNAQLAVNVLGCYISVEDGLVDDFKNSALEGKLLGDKFGGARQPGLNRFKASIDGVDEWLDEFIDVFELIWTMLSGSADAVIDVEKAKAAFRIVKNCKHHLSQRIMKDGTLEPVMTWKLRFEDAVSHLHRVEVLSKEPGVAPTCFEMVKMAFRCFHKDYVSMGLNKIIKKRDIQFSQGAEKLPLFESWSDFVEVIYAADAKFRLEENIGFRVQATANSPPH